MTTLQPGQQIGPYQVINQIGKGGMATVYKAYHAAVDRYVAIKIISNQLVENTEFLKRFQQEARLIARLEHPHILPIHDFGETDGVPYMVMRYLESGTLKERLKASPLTLPETDRIFSQLADALQYAHENGVIHRDIKPSNVMLDKRGSVFLTDFGVAKMLEGSSNLTATGAVTGTPDYMSPEQAQGLKVDGRSDVYSLGIVLFEMLTGRVPFEAETPLAVLFKQIQEPPPPLSVIRPDLPYQLEPVLLKALTKNPADRFANMEEFHDAWRRAISAILQEAPTAPSLAVSPQPEEEKPAVPPPAAPTARKRFPWLGLAAGLLGLFAIAAIFVFLRLGQNQAPQAPLQNLRQPETAAPSVASPTPDPTLPPRPVASGSGSVTSWAGGNTIAAMLSLNNFIYTGGPGGITEWNPVNGTATQWTMRDGLPSSYSSTLFQGPDGIWIGTTGGLVHLTTTSRELFTSYNGLDSDTITGLAWSKDSLLVGTQYCGGPGCGLQILKNGKFEPVKGFPSQEEPDSAHVSHNILFVYVDKQEQVWVGTDNGLALLDRRDRWRVFNASSGLPGARVFSMLEDNAGAIWVGTGEGGVSKFDSASGVFEQQFDLREQGIYDVTSMLQSADGNYWFAGYSLVEYDPQTQELTRYSPYEDNFPASRPVTLARGPGNVIFVGTVGEGLLRFEKGNGAQQWKIPNVPGQGGYSQIVPTAEGSLYFIEEFWNEVDQFIPDSGEWKTALAQDISIPRAVDSAGNIYSGAWDGLWIISPNGIRQQLGTETGLPSDEVYEIALDKDGNAWVGTSAGLVTLKGSVIVSATPGSELGLEGNAVRHVFVDSRGGIWAAGESGGNMAYLPSGGTWTLQSAYLAAGINPEFITDFAESPTGDLLVATYGGGLLIRTPAGEWKRIHARSEGVTQPIDYLLSVAAGPDGSLWLGLDDRAARFDGQTWRGFTLKDGMSGLKVYDIYIAPDGFIWFATNGGVTRFAP